jgi:hypothetical protein
MPRPILHVIEGSNEAPKPVVDEDTIETLKGFIEMAERGEVVQVAIAGVRPDGRGVFSWSTGGFNDLVACIARMSFRLQQAAIEDEQDDDC